MKKGQYSIEFLMTHSWAILLVLIVVGTILFVVFEPVNISEFCTIPLPFGCIDSKVDSTNKKVEILIQNYFDKPIMVHDLKAEIKSEGIKCKMLLLHLVKFNPSEKYSLITQTCTDNSGLPISSQKLKGHKEFKINITYSYEFSEYTYSAIGELKTYVD